jgi:hypothetical protein
MKRHLFGTIPLVALLCLAAWLGGRMPGMGQYPGPQGPMMWSSNCANSPQFGFAQACFDTTKQGVYYWNSTAFSPAANTSVWSGGSATISQGSTDYIAFGAQQTTTAQATQATAAMVWPFKGTAYDLYCTEATAADNTTGNSFTVNGGSAGTTAEALKCTMNTSLNTTSCNDTTDTFAIAAGDKLDIAVVNGNSSAATGIIGCSFLVH